MDSIITLIASYTSFATLAVPAVIEFIFTKIWQPTTKVWSNIVSFIIAILSTFVVYLAGKFFDIGFLVGVTNLLHVLYYGIGAGILATVAWVNIDWIKAIIRAIIGGDVTMWKIKTSKYLAKFKK